MDEGALALKDIVGEPSDESWLLLASHEDVPEEDVLVAFTGVPKARVKKALRNLRGDAPAKDAPQQQQQAFMALAGAGGNDLLPLVPNDDAWLQALQSQGVFTVTDSILNSGTRAFIAAGYGLFSVPGQLKVAMYRHTTALKEPVGQVFVEVDSILTARKGGAILNLVPGYKKAYASQQNRKIFLKAMETKALPALLAFNSSLSAWMTSLNSSPGVMLNILSANFGGQGGVLQLPDTGPVRSAGEAVAVNFNQAFSGFGAVCATAMAVEAAEIVKILGDSRLPGLVGAGNKEQMLHQLGLEVTSDVTRLEKGLVRLVLSIKELPKISPADEFRYLNALHMLCSQIPWDKIPKSAQVETEQDDDEEDKDEDSQPTRRRKAKAGAGGGKGNDSGRWDGDVT